MQRQMEADTVHMLALWRLRNWLVQPWVKGFKKTPDPECRLAVSRRGKKTLNQVGHAQCTGRCCI
ncbi:hypothetical protein ACFS07_09185 [Undibacterium arcticum]